MRKSFVANVVLRLSVAISVFGLATAAFAEAINVDFNYPGGGTGTYSGTAVAPDAGTTWNGWATPSTSPPGVNANVTSPVLVNSLGATPSAGFGTNVTVTLNGGNWSISDFGLPATNQAPALMGDALYTLGTSNTATFTINGLVAGASYDLYLYSENGFNYSANSGFTIGTQHNVNNSGSPSLGSSGFIDLRNYTTFLGVTASGGGTIDGSIVALDGNGSSFNGFQLVHSVPEPSSILLLICGGLGLSLVRRRRGINRLRTN